jgi:hypothetical protein
MTLKITQKTILKICQDEDQMELNISLIKYLEYLSSDKRTETEKENFAIALISSYKADRQEDTFNED